MIGSTNLANRSFYGDTELNASLWHGPTVRALRAELLREHLGRDTSALDDRAALRLYRDLARSNTERCVRGIQANTAHCQKLAEHSMGLATALNPYIGYAAAAEVAKEALSRGVSLRQVLLEKGYLTEAQLEAILDPFAMTQPGIPGKKSAREPGP